MAFVAYRTESIQYTGANGAAVAAWIHDSTLTSDNGTTLVVNVYDQGNISFAVGDWLLRSGGAAHNFAGNFTDTQYQNIYIEL
jgi:hypothetical protein